MAPALRAAAWGCLLLAAACSDSLDRFGFSAAATGGGSGGGSGVGATGGGSSGAGSGGATAGTATGAGADPCASLDLLFVVDNSPANQLAVANLTANIGLLADYMRGSGAPWADDFHVGFVRTHGTPGPCGAPGALSIDPAGAGACATQSGAAYATEGDGEALADVLACLAAFPEVAATPPPVALAAARGLGLALPGDVFQDVACNAGFARPQGLHAAVIIASGDDPGGGAGSPGGPETWFETFSSLAAPGAGSELILFGVVPDPASPPGCAPVAQTVKSWLSMHERAGTSDWCLVQDAPTQWVFEAVGALMEVCP